ncbi:MAG TPA: nucleotidyltransferase family protein [Steroidobacteraceae bacterium]|jgi:hypothetical protein
MSISGSAEPSPMMLPATLRKITETLAGELARPTEHAPDWSDFEWVMARAVAVLHGVSPLLSRTLRWQGPPDWAAFLDEQRAHTALRHVRIRELLRRIDLRAREEGVGAVALKGAALHAMGLYAAGERPMADIDLLVRPADAERAARMLESLGFYESCVSWKERVFTPVDEHAPNSLGEHSDNSIKIELHERICERLPWHITDVTEHVFPSQAYPGLNAYPSRASLMIHLLLHAAGSMAFQSLRLLHLHDLAQLSSLMTDADWDEVLAHGSSGRRLWWALPPLRLTSRYYSSRVPARVLAALGNVCPFLLERVSGHKSLYDVSYSYLWVDALPGAEWSQSFREFLGFAVSRVRPSADHVAMREQTAKTQAWAVQSQWAHLSQGRRVARWITSRPTRPATMHAVRAALARTQ